MGNKVGALRKFSTCANSEYDLAAKYNKNNSNNNISKKVGRGKHKSGDGSIECEVHIFNHPPSPSPNSPNLSPYAWNNDNQILPAVIASFYQNQQTIFQDETDILSKIGVLLNSADLNKKLQENLQTQDDPLTLTVTQGDLFCAKYDYNPTKSSMNSFLDENEPILNLIRNEFCLLLDQHLIDR